MSDPAHGEGIRDRCGGAYCGDDPHENPRATASARVQKSEFLKVGGRVVDVCGGKPCYAAPYTGP
jgi:hypothetical protein